MEVKIASKERVPPPPPRVVKATVVSQPAAVQVVRARVIASSTPSPAGADGAVDNWIAEVRPDDAWDPDTDLALDLEFSYEEGNIAEDELELEV